MHAGNIVMQIYGSTIHLFDPVLNGHMLNARCSCLVQELAGLLRSLELTKELYTQLGVQCWACWISIASFLLGFNETLLGRTLNGWSNDGNKHFLQIGLTQCCAVVSRWFLGVASKPWHSRNCWSVASFPHVEGWIFNTWESQPLVAWLYKWLIFRSLCTAIHHCKSPFLTWNNWARR